MNERMNGNTTTTGTAEMERAAALRKLQQLNFAMIELALYLNNQPKCEEALTLYDKVRCMYADAKVRFEECFGPLTYEGVNTRKDGWSWIAGPWPWEGEC